MAIVANLHKNHSNNKTTTPSKINNNFVACATASHPQSGRDEETAIEMANKGRQCWPKQQ